MIHLHNSQVGRSTAVKRLAAAIALGASALIAAPALASDGFGISSTILATGDLNPNVNYNHDRIKFQTKDAVDVRVQRLVFAVGAYTGWHHHPGVVIVTVESGLIATVDHNCQIKTYGPGSPNGSVFVEGHETPMEARNAASTVSTVYATYVAPDASPPKFRIEDDAQSCSTATTFRQVKGQ